ncbi:hypothetical protein EMCG_04066 [[Emmonsia] crescens]|uniref:Uncharacterized protein n=1 Tax=[Emmonsia] crescens TaxID=73230 RepID=A0A0G2HT68_9EURO|nr:hypothetical protein EMCG_04066 [Emmonsia crescens UAMH 3008]
MYYGIRNSVNSSRSGSGRGRRSHSEPAPLSSGTTFRRAQTDPTRPPPSYTTIFGPTEAGDAIPLHEFPTVEPCSRPLETIPEAKQAPRESHAVGQKGVNPGEVDGLRTQVVARKDGK